MANTDNPQGLRPIRHRNGAAYNGAGNVYHIAALDAQTIAPGDPVLVTGEADTNGIPTVAQATAGSRITGIMASRTNGAGTVLQDNLLNTTASDANAQYILVHDDPDLVFEAQVSASIAAGDISANADLTADTTPAAGKSGFEVDSTSFNVTATLQVRVMRLRPIPNNALGTNAKVEVMINLHTNAVGVGSLGI